LAEDGPERPQRWTHFVQTEEDKPVEQDSAGGVTLG